MDELKRIVEWAKILGLPVKTIRNACKRGHLRAYQTGRSNSPYRTTEADIRQWLESRAVENKAQRPW